MASELILVIEDCPVNLKLTRLLLVSEGYRVLTAHSGEQALEVLHNYHPDLILADIQMPGMDGLTLTRHIKHDERTCQMPVIALTALAMVGDMEKALDAGCDGYLAKPIQIRHFRGHIRDFLDCHAGRNGNTAIQPAGTLQPIPAPVFHDLRHRFQEEGCAEPHQWLSQLRASFRPDDVTKKVHQWVVHQWVRAGALFGFGSVNRTARDVETVLRERPVDQGELRESLVALNAHFEASCCGCSAPGEAA
jgi:two-component system, cell cycle response regulator DivK